MRISLGVGVNNPNVPVILERETAQALVIHTFMDFQTDIADPTKAFEVPKQCQE